jgi:RNA polymerase sigma factor (sigma-70 family)
MNGTRGERKIGIAPFINHGVSPVECDCLDRHDGSLSPVHASMGVARGEGAGGRAPICTPRVQLLQYSNRSSVYNSRAGRRRHNGMAQDPDQQIADVVRQEQSRLRHFIRRRVANAQDVEDIVQDVFAELVEANRRLMPIDHVTGWLFRVARNRITDLFRRKQPERFSDALIVSDEGDFSRVEDLLPSREAGPDDVYARHVLIEELQRALAELPDEQRRVFVAHEIEGRTFKEMAAEAGININTLLARKHYAVLHLRARLQRAFDELRRQRG